MQNVYKIANVFSEEDLAIINEIVDAAKPHKEDYTLGRALYSVAFPHEVADRLKEKLKPLLGKKFTTGLSASYVEYRKEYGQPNLPPHFDGDDNSLIIDYQLKSNTSWGIGLDTNLFPMADNDALIFNPNEYPHWRPHKTFEDGEYVGMIFFRFPDDSGNTDYSHKRYLENDPILKDSREFRNSLNMIK